MDRAQRRRAVVRLRSLAITLTFLPVLWPGVAASTGEEAPRIAVSPGSGDLGTLFTFEAHGFEVAPGRNLLEDPDFSAGGGPWQFGAGEIGGKGQLLFPNGTGDTYARISIGNATKPGTVFLHQTVPLTGAKAYSLSFDGRGSSGLQYQILARERDFDAAARNMSRSFADTQLPATIPANWQTQTWAWAPQFNDSRTVTVYLRVAVPSGASGTADFDHVSLRPIPALEWDIDSDGEVDGVGRKIERQFQDDGMQTVTLQYSALDGATQRVTSQVDVVNRAPVVSFDAPTATIGVPQQLVATVEDPDAGEQLTNGDFGDGLSGWQWSSGEVGGDGGAFESGDEELILRGNATKNGTIYAYSTASLQPGWPLDLVATYRDDGVRHRWLLRERAGNVTADTLLEPPSSRDWSRFHQRWVPQLDNATSITLYLRYALSAGSSGEARFADVSLRLAPKVVWDFNADGAVDAVGENVTWTFTNAGIHQVSLVGRDAAGAETRVGHPVKVLAAAPRIAIDGPDVAVLRETHTFSLRDGGSTPNLLSADFDPQRWKFGNNEIGGSSSWAPRRTESQVWGRVEIDKATKNGTIFLHQDVPVEAGKTYSFRVKGADDGGIQGYAYILRERGFNQTFHGTPQPYVDTMKAFPSAPAGAVHEITWSPRFDDTDRVTVYLRARVLANATTVVEWMEPVFAEHLDRTANLTFSWEASQATILADSGRSTTVRFDTPGLATVQIESDGGSHARGRQEKQVLVLPEAVRATPTVRSGMLFEWALPEGMTANVAWRGGGTPDSKPLFAPGSGPGAQRFQLHVLAPSSSGVLVMELEGGARFILANGSSAASAQVVTFAEPVARFPAPSRDLVVTVRAADPAITQLVLELQEEGGGVAHRVAMTRVGNETFAGRLPLSWGDALDSYRLTVVARDVYGYEQVEPLDGTIRVSPLEGVDPFRPLLLAIILVGLMVAAQTAWRRTGGRGHG